MKSTAKKYVGENNGDNGEISPMHNKKDDFQNICRLTTMKQTHFITWPSTRSLRRSGYKQLKKSVTNIIKRTMCDILIFSVFFLFYVSTFKMLVRSHVHDFTAHQKVRTHSWKTNTMTTNHHYSFRCLSRVLIRLFNFLHIISSNLCLYSKEGKGERVVKRKR